MSIDRAIPNLASVRSLGHLARGLRHDAFYAALHRRCEGLEDLGDPADACNWTICTRGLGPASIVYSAGVGRDISFEHALADRFGVRIVLLDPSPTGLETMALAENRRAEFDFLPVALAGEPGEIELAPPPNPAEGSWVAADLTDKGPAHAEARIRVPAESLASLMRKRGHDRIDLIKMDIEGAEFAVLDSILSAGIRVRQIAVEFHNAVLAGVRRSQTTRMLLKLFAGGYRVIDKGGSNHTLIHRSALRGDPGA